MALIQVGIIGLGGVGRRHIEGVLDAPGCFRLKSICDVQPERLKALGEEFGIIDRTTDYHDILEDPTIDAVIVLLPHDLHERVCVEAAQLGKHILVEKPIARSLEEADRIIQAAEEAGVTLMVGHNQRYDPIHVKTYDLVQDGALGQIFCARIDHHQDFDRPRGHWWRSQDAVGGGCVIGSGIHRLDLLRWWVGEVDQVFAYQVGDPRRLEAEVASVATLRFRNGAIGEFVCNWGVHRAPLGEGFSLFGREGSLFLKDRQTLLVVNPTREEFGPELVEVAADEACVSMWVHFSECVASGATPLTSGPEGRRSLELVLAIYRSAEIGSPVGLPLLGHWGPGEI